MDIPEKEAEKGSILDEPTNEYAMRHAANELNRMTSKFDIPAKDQERLNYAYQQLLRGANTLHDLGITSSADPAGP